MLSVKLDLLMKKLDDKARDKKEVMHVYDSHMTCEECGDCNTLGVKHALSLGKAMHKHPHQS